MMVPASGKIWTLHDPRCPSVPPETGACRCLVSENKQLKSQIERMKDVVDAACALDAILGFDDLNSAYQSRRDTMDAFVKAVDAYKTWLPSKEGL